MATPTDNLNLPAYFEVRETLNKYLEGIRTGDLTLLKSAFDANAHLHGTIMGNIVNGPIDTFYNDVATILRRQSQGSRFVPPLSISRSTGTSPELLLLKRPTSG